MELSRLKSVEDVRTAWHKCEEAHSRTTREQVEIIKHCLENEISLEWLKPHQRTAFLLMAQGQVLIEAFDKFGCTSLWNKVRRLPLNEQKRLSEGGRVAVLVKVGEKWETKKSDPMSLSKLEIAQVFGPNGIQGDEEQRSFLDSMEKKHFTALVNSAEVRVDRKKEGVWINGELYTRSVLAKWLADLT